ncbi:MAG: GTPase [Dokdonella sp.]
MSTSRLPLRLIVLALLGLAVAVLFGLAVSTLNSALELYQRLLDLPLLARVPLMLALAIAIAAIAVLAWKLLRPTQRRGQRRDPTVPPSREQIETRVADLSERGVDSASLEQELAELDRRRLGGDCHVALFGEISTGKSSLIRTLAPHAAVDVDVLGGTTRRVKHFRGLLPDGRELVLADIPGSAEVDGAQREQLARDEALRAHLVLYLAASDLTRAQDAELRWLASFGKPLVLVLNKIDLFDVAERAALTATLRSRYRDVIQSLVHVSGGGLERFERALEDGRRERVERERTADVAPLLETLVALTSIGVDALEPARAAAVLAHVDLQAGELARVAAERESEATVVRYTRRAIVGALAAVAPGSDIIIQGALGTAMVRELARIHDVSVRELDVDGLLSRLGLTVRNTTALVLAIAGNALKAFPGLGTLGGGVLHAIAYGLVFDSVGRAIALTLAENARLDMATAERHVHALLAEPGRERVERVARLVLDTLRNNDSRRTDGD